MQSADTGNVKSQCRAVDVVNDMPDAYHIQYLQFLQSPVQDTRVWKGFCVIRDSAEIERVIREYRKNPAVICEFYIGCDAGFSLYVVRDS